MFFLKGIGVIFCAKVNSLPVVFLRKKNEKESYRYSCVFKIVRRRDIRYEFVVSARVLTSKVKKGYAIKITSQSIAQY